MSDYVVLSAHDRLTIAENLLRQLETENYQQELQQVPEDQRSHSADKLSAVREEVTSLREETQATSQQAG